MLKSTLKFLLAFALCYWLFTNGKLDFSLVLKSFHLGYLWLLGILFFIIHMLLNSLRFQKLLEAKSGSTVAFLKVLSFDAVGSFFSVILTGSAAGDIVRFFYYKNLHQKLTPTTVGALLILDRIMGLLGLLVLGAVVCLIQFNTLRNLNPSLLTLVYFNIFLLIGVLIFTILIFSDVVPEDFWLIKFSKYLKRWPKIETTYTELLSLKLSPAVLSKSLLISIAGHAFTIGCFWAVASPFIPETVSFLNVFTIIPIGFIGASLPITPAGLGVGHLLFENLFSMLHIDHGASIFNLYFMVNIVISLLGVFPYLMIKKDLTKIEEVSV